MIADPPARTKPPSIGPAGYAPSWDLDGLYLWIGPAGSVSWVDADWDSTFGADIAVVRVRERNPLAALGITVGASRWTARGGGRVWVDAIAGTKLGKRIYGVTLGPVVELSDLAHPRAGMSIGIWGFTGITPYARAGIVDELGPFVEVGVHIALPVLRR